MVEEAVSASEASMTEVIQTLAKPTTEIVQTLEPNQASIKATVESAVQGGTESTRISSILEQLHHRALGLSLAMDKEVTKIESDDTTSVEIKVLLFARARELTGVPDLTLKMPSGSTTQKCMDELVLKFPSLEEVRSCVVLALNEEYTTDSTIVNHRDELAIIPPISGG